MAKHPGGRPREYNDEQIKEIKKAFEEYVENTEIPIVSEFAYKNDVMRQHLYDYPEFSTILKKCTSKKESALERLGLTNQVNTAMAIFSLKQLGWKDRTEQTITHHITEKEIEALEELFE